MNSLGYSLVGEHRFDEGIGALRLVAYVYPDSANAEDSLGDAYLAAGQSEKARDWDRDKARLMRAKG